MAKVIKKGDKGSIVKIIQELLNKLLKSGLDVTSVFDDATREAVKAFQKKYNLKPVDGVIGEATGIKMNELSGDKLKGAFPTAKEAAAAEKMPTPAELIPPVAEELSKIVNAEIPSAWTKTIGRDVYENFARMWLNGPGLKRLETAIAECKTIAYNPPLKELAATIAQGRKSVLGGHFPLTNLNLMLMENWKNFADALYKQCTDADPQIRMSERGFMDTFMSDKDCHVMVSDRVKAALGTNTFATKATRQNLYDLMRPFIINHPPIKRHVQNLAMALFKQQTRGMI